MFLRKILRKIFGNIWISVLIVVIASMLYQNFSSYNGEVKAEDLPKNNVDFVTIQQSFLGSNSPGFAELLNQLTTWKFDQKNKQVYLKFDALMPKDNTKVMVIFDRGFDNFDKYSDVFSVASFPYLYNFQGQELVTVEGVEKSGVVYLEYSGKHLKLNPGQSYTSWSIEGWRISKTTITNQGIYAKSQFKKMPNNSN